MASRLARDRREHGPPPALGRLGLCRGHVAGGANRTAAPGTRSRGGTPSGRHAPALTQPMRTAPRPWPLSGESVQTLSPLARGPAALRRDVPCPGGPRPPPPGPPGDVHPRLPRSSVGLRSRLRSGRFSLSRQSPSVTESGQLLGQGLSGHSCLSRQRRFCLTDRLPRGRADGAGGWQLSPSSLLPVGSVLRGCSHDGLEG